MLIPPVSDRALRRLPTCALLAAVLALAAPPGLAAPPADGAKAKAPAAAADGLEEAVAECHALLERRPSPFVGDAEDSGAPDPLERIGALEAAAGACRERVMTTYAGSPARLAKALKPLISDDGRLWFVGADVVTGGSAHVVAGRFYRVDEAGRLQPAGEASAPDPPDYHAFYALPSKAGTAYLALGGQMTCNTCERASAHVLHIVDGKVVQGGGISLEFRMDDGELSLEPHTGKALRRIPGERGRVAVLRYRIGMDANDHYVSGWTGEVGAPGGPGNCPTAPVGKAGQGTEEVKRPPADPTSCVLAGRIVVGVGGFSILDVNGRCVDDLSPGLRRLCRSGL